MNILLILINLLGEKLESYVQQTVKKDYLMLLQKVRVYLAVQMKSHYKNVAWIVKVG